MLLEHRARHADQIVHDRNHDFGLNVQAARDQQIVGTMHGTGKAVFDRRKNVVRKAFVECSSTEPQTWGEEQVEYPRPEA